MAVWLRPPKRTASADDQRSPGSERPVVIQGIAAFVGITVSPLIFERLAQLIAMERQDLVPDLVDQFEHGESFFRRPEPGDLDGNWTRMHRRRRALWPTHVLPPRR